MFNQYRGLLFVIFVQKFKEPETGVRWQLIVVSLTRSSAVAKRPRDAPCHWTFCCHWITRFYTVEYSVCKFLLILHCNYVSISCTVSEILYIEYGLTLKSGFGVIQGYWKWHHSIDCIYSSYIITTAISCIVSEILVKNRDF